MNGASPEYDFIVVGSGSAGGIVAARLAEDRSCRILLVEAGPRDNSVLLRIPAAMRYVYDAPKYNWSYETEAEPFLHNRRLKQPRGRVLGGSSSINGQLYLRGHPLDYESWAESGASGWSYAHVLPYFKRLETRLDGASEYRGADGPVRVTTAPPGTLARAFLEAGAQAGYRSSKDVNGFQQDGFGLLPKNTGGGRRSSTAQGYLRNPPGNLHIRTNCTVDRILFRGRQACGIDYTGGGERREAHARREIVACAGAIDSPILLMKSGIGPAAHLREFGIDVIHDSPGVGENLMDHPLTSVQVACREPVTLFRHFNPVSKAVGILSWVFARKGILASNHFDAVAFIRTASKIKYPNLQIALFPIAVAEGSSDFVMQHSFQLQLSLQRPLSRGYVRLGRANGQNASVRIRYNMLERRHDLQELKAGIALCRELLRQPALARYAGDELSPGEHVADERALETWLRETCYSSYHPCGTCRMGIGGSAVVDNACRVRGVTGLRIADASIMPSIPSANLNCPTMMIGEKAADHISGKEMAPQSNLPFFVDPDWETAQR